MIGSSKCATALTPGRAALVVLVAVLHIGCFLETDLSRDDVMSIYEFSHQFGDETILLSPKGEYFKTLEPNGGSPLVCRGSWEFAEAAPNSDMTGPVVILRDAEVFVDHQGKKVTPSRKTDWQLQVVENQGRLELRFNPDLPGYRSIRSYP